MFSIEKVYTLMMSDPNIELVTSKKGRKHTNRYYRMGILHIVVIIDNSTMDIIGIKISKMF